MANYGTLSGRRCHNNFNTLTAHAGCRRSFVFFAYDGGHVAPLLTRRFMRIVLLVLAALAAEALAGPPLRHGDSTLRKSDDGSARQHLDPAPRRAHGFTGTPTSASSVTVSCTAHASYVSGQVCVWRNGNGLTFLRRATGDRNMLGESVVVPAQGAEVALCCPHLDA